MSTTNHISFEELASNVTAVLNKVREERRTVVVEYANGEKLVIKPMLPAKKSVRRSGKRSKADIEAFRASAGTWQDEDVDTFIHNIYESRQNSSRPPVEL